MNDNIHYLGGSVEEKDVVFTPDDSFNEHETDNGVQRMCDTASSLLVDVVILGATEDGTVKMLTTQDDVADILFYLEVAKKSLLDNGVSSDD